MPMNVHALENATDPEKATASTGRSARSTSSPQTRRKRRVNNGTAASNQSRAGSDPA